MQSVQQHVSSYSVLKKAGTLLPRVSQLSFQKSQSTNSNNKLLLIHLLKGGGNRVYSNDAGGLKRQNQVPDIPPHSDKLHGAKHQVQHRVSEKAGFKIVERILERVFGEETVTRIGERLSQKAGSNLVRGTSKIGQQILEKSGERVIDQTARIIERAGETGVSRGGKAVLQHGSSELLSRGVEHAGGSVVEHSVERAAVRAAERGGEHGVYSSVRLAERGAERAAENISTRLGEQAVHGGSELLSRGVEHVGGSVVEHSVERAAVRAAERGGEHGVYSTVRLAERGADHAVENITTRLGEQAAQRTSEHVLEKGGERVLQRAFGHSEQIVVSHLPQSLERISSVVKLMLNPFVKIMDKMGEAIGRWLFEPIARLAEEAVTTVARMLGRTPGEWSVRALARAGRGLSVGVPALGALLVFHLTMADRKRMRKEFGSGSFYAGVSFLVAYLMDMMDVCAHIVIVIALANQHFGVGFHVSHFIFELAEYGGLGAAVVATLAAVVGELVAITLNTKQSHP